MSGGNTAWFCAHTLFSHLTHSETTPRSRYWYISHDVAMLGLAVDITRSRLLPFPPSIFDDVLRIVVLGDGDVARARHVLS